MEKQFYTLTEVSEIIGMSYGWLNRMINQGKIEVIWFGGHRRISSDELNKIMTQGVS